MHTLLRALVSLLLLPSLVSAAGGRSLTYQIDAKAYEGYYISPAADAPLVLLLHDWDGLTDYEIQRAHMLAELGYAVFAADLFGAGVRPTRVEDKRRQIGELYRDRPRLRALMDAALDEAAAQGADRANAVAVGYSFGGAAVLELARSGAPLKGFVTFYGRLATPGDQDYANTRGEILVLHGSADRVITMDQFAALANELEQAGVGHEMISYGGAPHGFTVFGSERYREGADRKSWERLSGFLRERLQ